ncbi:MAG: glycosyltransferase, partial [Clostridia bacterium]|nr:glycosyltransferase [Clostridia bacterium]
MLQNKSRVLFVLQRTELGGSAASLLNLLSLLKEEGIVCDLFLMDHNGSWTEKASKLCNLLPKDPVLEASLTEKKNLHSVLQYCYRISHVLSNKILGTEQSLERLYRKRAARLSDRYDCVVAYQESETTHFARFITAKRLVAWVHTDFEKFWKIKYGETKQRIYEKYHHIVCVTDASVKSVIETLSRPKDQVHLIRNTLPINEITSRSQEQIEDLKKSENEFVFVSIGRFGPEKAQERIPEAAKILKEAGCSFSWYLIGDGERRALIEEKIASCDVGDCVHLTGAKMNPYPYIRQADCLVITSLYEAQPMVANESLILDTPVISTAFASVYEVLKQEENGLIAEQSAQSIAAQMLRFMQDKDLCEKLNRSAKAFVYSN